jgi:hypothetical protein
MAIVIRNNNRRGALNKEIFEDKCCMLLCVQLQSFISSMFTAYIKLQF